MQTSYAYSNIIVSDKNKIIKDGVQYFFYLYIIYSCIFKIDTF